MTSATSAPEALITRDHVSPPVSTQYIDAPDHLVGGVIRSLARPLAPQLSWGVLKTSILGIVTLGIWPLIDWILVLAGQAHDGQGLPVTNWN
jgi:hypothetical protein